MREMRASEIATFFGPTKVCVGCSQRLSLDAFGKRSSSSDGKANRCVICMRSYKNAWQERNPEKRAKANQAYLNRMRVAEKPITSTLKSCSKCKAEKPLSAFYGNRKMKDGRNAQCAACSLDDKRRRYYGISSSDFDAMWTSQEGKCPICTGSLSGPQHNACAVDHNHITGKVRGLLCLRCNVGLGNLKDSAEICLSAAAYLKRGDLANG